MEKKKIVVFALDDDHQDLELLKRHLNSISYWEVDFYPFDKWETFKEDLNRHVIDVLFVDYCLGALTGLDVINELRTFGERRPIIVLTGKGDERIAARLMKAGADDYLVKEELSPDLLRRTIVNAIEIVKSKEEMAVLEKQLQESQKMETLGTLAGGIAHDFNNLLMAIMGYADFAKMKSKGRDIEADLDNIISTSQQMAGLVKQLLSFSGGEKHQMEMVDIGQVLMDSASILRHTIPEQVTINIEASEKPVLILADKILLNQIILNICINAAEAMPSGGEISIKYGTVEIENEYMLSHPNLADDELVLLEIKDTGKGMPSEVKQRIFEPFFTTKKLGRKKGTGLGLSVVWNNVKKLNGSIDVISQVNSGTLFKLFLPSGKRHDKSYHPQETRNFMGQEETVLVVDDEKLVLKLASKMLTLLNYKVYVASNGSMAIDLYRKLYDEIDVVILDLSMPEMDGKACIKKLLDVRPDSKIIFSSGYDFTDEADTLKQLGCAGLIQKPYFLSDLGKRIRSVLSQ